MSSLRWDVFCRVIDNLGDIGVCWRLCRRLAALGDTVRLWVDDASALQFMAPTGAQGVTVRPWSDPGPHDTPGDVVVEAFACDPPARFVERMVQTSPTPVWINLEYLSAEAASARHHRLPSPQRNGLHKWFFYPGFEPSTGGLLREAGLGARREAFDRTAWLASRGIPLRPDERLVSLFCYRNPRLSAWWEWLGAQPTLLLLTPGWATEQAQALPLPPGLRTLALPWLDQDGYDELLWACDLNFVRGEDSLVRGLWAGQPLLWQIYPQDDGAHAAKLAAFLDVYLAGAEPALAGPIRRLAQDWAGTAPMAGHTGQGGAPAPEAAPDFGAWQAQARAVAARLAAGPELALSLRQFCLDQHAGA
jgi:uncharacterized repeat protein (TIGR03837 family)